jgi:hypothetical protein
MRGEGRHVRPLPQGGHIGRVEEQVRMAGRGCRIRRKAHECREAHDQQVPSHASHAAEYMPRAPEALLAGRRLAARTPTSALLAPRIGRP